MAHGIIHDLAVGVHPGGADAWAHQDLLVAGFSVGAPPDSFNQLGQDWSQPPWHPQRLAAAGYRPLAELFAATLPPRRRAARGSRDGADAAVVDTRGHAPPTAAPTSATTTRPPSPRWPAAAARAAAVAIGEDLGTVDQWIRELPGRPRHPRHHDAVVRQRARTATPLPPEHWRRGCMATVGTHDVPPVAGFLTGDQVTVRARLGLLTDLESGNGATSRGTGRPLAGQPWRRKDCCSPARQPGPAEFTVALYGYLGKTPALLVGVSLADAVGDTRTQNIPGTSDEYPNWRIPLCDGERRPVLLEELPALPLVRRQSAGP